MPRDNYHCGSVLPLRPRNFAKTTRLYSSGIKVHKATYVNLLEEPMQAEEGEVVWKSDKDGLLIDLDLRAFEIQTIKIWV